MNAGRGLRFGASPSISLMISPIMTTRRQQGRQSPRSSSTVDSKPHAAQWKKFSVSIFFPLWTE